MLPYRSRSFDAALSIAVLHHLSTDARRELLVAETMRVVRVGGEALFYAWALEQEEGGRSGHRFEGKDVLVPFHLRVPSKGGGASPEPEPEPDDDDPSPLGVSTVHGPAAEALRKAKARSPAAATLCAAAEAAGGEWDGGKGAFVFQRYCHVYEKGELPKLFAPISGWVSVQDEYYDAGNWCVVCRREK